MSTITKRKPKSRKSTEIKSGPALMAWRQNQGISRPLFAQMADCSERKLATYEKARSLPKKVQRPITETVRLILALRELAGDATALKEWLQRPNPAFGRKTPLSLIIDGKSDLLWEMVCQIRQGSFA